MTRPSLSKVKELASKHNTNMNRIFNLITMYKEDEYFAEKRNLSEGDKQTIRQTIQNLNNQLREERTAFKLYEQVAKFANLKGEQSC